MPAGVVSKKELFAEKNDSSWTEKDILDDGCAPETANSINTKRNVTVKDRTPVPVD